MQNTSRLERVKAEDLVLVANKSVAVGDQIPADCSLLSIQSNSFGVIQSILIGEIETVEHTFNAIKLFSHSTAQVAQTNLTRTQV